MGNNLDIDNTKPLDVYTIIFFFFFFFFFAFFLFLYFFPFTISAWYKNMARLQKFQQRASKSYKSNLLQKTNGKEQRQRNWRRMKWQSMSRLENHYQAPHLAEAGALRN